MSWLIRFLATGFFAGYLPYAPGTYGTVLSGLIYLLVFPSDTLARICILALSVPAAVFLSGSAEKVLGKKDDRRIVIDEVVGFWLVLAFVPRSLKIGLAAFVLFRVFDAYKPRFVRKIEKLPAGLGVVGDDIAAALLTIISVRLAMAFARAVF